MQFLNSAFLGDNGTWESLDILKTIRKAEENNTREWICY